MSDRELVVTPDGVLAWRIACQPWHSERCPGEAGKAPVQVQECPYYRLTGRTIRCQAPSGTRICGGNQRGPPGVVWCSWGLPSDRRTWRPSDDPYVTGARKRDWDFDEL